MKIRKASSKRRALIAGISLLSLIGVGAVAFSFYSDSSSDVKRDEDGTSLERSSAELSETKQIVDTPGESKQKTHSDNVPEPASNSTTGLRDVNVILTSVSVTAEQVEASAFVSNLVEEGGSCTFTFTRNEKIVNKTTDTSVNPTSTTCKTIRFNQSELDQGEWKVKVQYSSLTAKGTSNEGSLVIK